jgi:hypothetical protein
MLENEYVKYEREIRAVVNGICVFERELSCTVRDGFVVFGSMKENSFLLSILSPTQIRLSEAVVSVQEPQLIAKL